MRKVNWERRKKERGRRKVNWERRKKERGMRKVNWERRKKEGEWERRKKKRERRKGEWGNLRGMREIQKVIISRRYFWFSWFNNLVSCILIYVENKVNLIEIDLVWLNLKVFSLIGLNLFIICFIFIWFDFLMIKVYNWKMILKLVL